MSLTMDQAEREAFLAELHVGVLCVNQAGAPPLAVPVWYSYEPGGPVSVITGGSSIKARCITTAGCFSLCVQSEQAPYAYVSVEGPVSATETTVDEAERRAMAHRYLGPEFGDLYLAATEADAAASVLFRMTPARWRTSDFSKQFS
jgi:nitroimidazol reductase NimA-like FMN-containing flavoprotein (pyridoxamine 5'-phosphate oxidase superfamily)